MAKITRPQSSAASAALFGTAYLKTLRLKRTTPLKFAGSSSVAALMLCAAVTVGMAAPPQHPGGGGGHPAAAPHAAAPHVAAPHVSAAPHFAAHASAPHFSASHAAAHAAPHFSSAHVAHFNRSAARTNAVHANAVHTNAARTNAANAARLSSHGTSRFGHASRFSHATPSARALTTTAHPLTTTAHPLNANALPVSHAAFNASPHAFAANRAAFATNPTYRPFWGHGWHPYHHLGWIGPVFWPYAYGDVFYYALWPGDYGYVDPFWAYGYGDIYESIFSPYSYDEYVQGPSAPQRMATLTQSMAQSCADEAAEVTGWPIDQIQAAVQPSQDQTALLDNFGNAIVKASDEIKTHCPTTVSFTPTARLGEMQQRLQTLDDAVNIVSPPLDQFYASLSDEQKARFNDITPPQQGAQANAQAPQNPQASQSPPPQNPPPQNGQSAPSMQAQCNANVMAWPTDRIDHVVHPNDAQRGKLEALQSAASQAADTIRAACPSAMPATPPERLAAVGQHLQAMLQAVETVRPALADFYGSLSDDQKARFNGMGRELFAQNQE
jgi:LTXXQ motif family protein